jgi:hypothetical protein
MPLDLGSVEEARILDHMHIFEANVPNGTSPQWCPEWTKGSTIWQVRRENSLCNLIRWVLPIMRETEAEEPMERGGWMGIM